jgi:LuxR family maltose regulon positive regulatory protein
MPLALLVAPAGYGKTTLLAQWDMRDKRPFGWLTLEEGDNEPERLVHSIAAILGVPDSGATPTLPRLLELIQTRPRPFVLVMDDAQVLHHPAALEVLTAVVAHLPSGSQLAVASRGEPAMPVGRLRAHRNVVEVRHRDFVMTPSEGTALLDTAGFELADDEREVVLGRAEGWPAGLYLSGLALMDDRDERVVADYLRDEILGGLSRDRLTFLTRASILERLSGPACDAILERSGSARLLIGLERSNVLLFPVRGEDCYRLHPLLARALRAELRRSEPDLEVDLHRRASGWHTGRGETDRAIRHAVAAHDAGLAGKLLWNTSLGYVSYGHNATVQRWLDHFTPVEIAAHPALALVAAASRLAGGDRNLAEHWISAASRELAGGALNGETGTLEAGVMVLRAGATPDGIARMGEDAMEGYERLPDDSPWRSVCCLFAGAAQQLSGDRDAARALLREGARRGAVAAPNVQALCLAQLALLALEEEDWANGEPLAARARAQVERCRLSDYPTSALVFAVSAAFRAHRGRIDEAKMDARRATQLTAMLRDFPAWYEVEIRVALACAALRLSDAAGASRLLEEATRLARGAPVGVELRGWLDASWTRVRSVPTSAVAPRWSLTTAELRVLLLLPTHLSFPEVAVRLNVSANTVKSHARAVYRKLGVTSRAEAVTRAGEAGLIDTATAALAEAA